MHINSGVSYADTCLLMMFVRKNDALRKIFDVGRGSADSIFKKKSFCVPIVSLGEAFHQIRQKDPNCYDDPIKEMNRLLDKGFLKTRFISNPRSTFSLAREIADFTSDDRDQISAMDALIISSAATDQTCSLFYTTDSKLTSNSNVTDIIDDWRSDHDYDKMSIVDASSLF